MAGATRPRVLKAEAVGCIPAALGGRGSGWLTAHRGARRSSQGGEPHMFWGWQISMAGGGQALRR